MDERREAVEQNDETLKKDQLIALLGVYYSERQSRDSILWEQTFRLFYANLIVMFLPFLTDKLIDLPFVKWTYPLCGLIMSIFSLYISLGYAARYSAAAETCKEMENLIGYKSVSLDELGMVGKFTKPRIAYVLVYTLFLVQIILSSVCFLTACLQ